MREEGNVGAMYYTNHMTLYETLAPLYDSLFPINSKATPFLDSLIPAERRSQEPRALDAGCATGAHALGLATLGWKVVGIDSEAAMIDAAQKLAIKAGLSEKASFLEADILGVEERFGTASFDLVICLGNTLPHLGNSGAASFLAQAHALLAPGGVIVLQTLNFSMPGIGPGYVFPKITAGTATMKRCYRSPSRDHPETLRFVVELVSDGKSRLGETNLTPLGPKMIGSLLGDAGFKRPVRHSGWDGHPFDEDRDLYCLTVAGS